jgi:hypothetical protein
LATNTFLFRKHSTVKSVSEAAGGGHKGGGWVGGGGTWTQTSRPELSPHQTISVCKMLRAESDASSFHSTACSFQQSTEKLHQSMYLEATVDNPQIGHLSDPGKPVAFRSCPISGPHAIAAARPSPQKPVTLRTCPTEELSDLRVSDLRTVNCFNTVN